MYYANRTVDRLMKQTGHNLILEQHTAIYTLHALEYSGVCPIT